MKKILTKQEDVHAINLEYAESAEEIFAKWKYIKNKCVTVDLWRIIKY